MILKEKMDENYTETSKDKTLLRYHHYVTYATSYNVNHKYSDSLAGGKRDLKAIAVNCDMASVLRILNLYLKN